MSPGPTLFLRVIYCIVAVVFTTPAWAEKKVALVIGNSAYEHSAPLKNPKSDARAVSALFSEHGFDTTLMLDLDRIAFTRALSDFSELAVGADVAIFYYAGHGVSLDGRNYLIPTDSVINRAIEVKLGAGLDAELAIDQALADAKVKLVFLDACRDNPFVEQIKRSLGTTRSASVASGLSEMKSGDGTLIAFSTAPGQVAADGEGDLSPFASALLENIAEPGLEIRLAMTKVRADVEVMTGGKQMPWESTNLTGFYYFSPASPEESAAEQPSIDNTAKDITSELELEFWRNVKDSNNTTLLESYLQNFPNGLYRPIAEELLKQLDSRSAESGDRKNTITETEGAAGPVTDQSADAIPDGTVMSSGASGTQSNAIPEPRPSPNLNKEQKTKKNGINPKDNKSSAGKAASPGQTIAKKEKTSSDQTEKTKNAGKDNSAFLSKSVKFLGGGSGNPWKLPPGATRSSNSITYKGRTYKCSSRGAPGDWGSGAVYCRPQ